jgi:hypothetical protein
MSLKYTVFYDGDKIGIYHFAIVDNNGDMYYVY